LARDLRTQTPTRLRGVLLALDTATHAVTVALHDGDNVVAKLTTIDPLRHGELLAPSIDAVLRQAGAAVGDLSRIAVGVGPGPFTGLRVGIVTARTLAAARNLPLDGVCTLDVVAFAVRVDEPFMVATDARRKEIYHARYARPTQRLMQPAVDKPERVASAGPVAGLGATLYPEWFPRAVPPEHPDAADLARLVVSGAAQLLAPDPLYLRRPDAVEPATRKHVS
jgi:tRNA threonylcarbamoyladenosine biosynthesis protein TsaB